MYSFEHLDLFYEEEFQLSIFSNLDEDEVMIFPEQDSLDETFQALYFPLSLYVTEDADKKHAPCPKLSLRKKIFLEFKGRLDALRINLMSHSFSLPSSNYQSSSRFLFISSRVLVSDEVQGSQPLGFLSQPHEY
jgi:hypothetical protein